LTASTRRFIAPGATPGASLPLARARTDPVPAPFSGKLTLGKNLQDKAWRTLDNT
jgi:hypothetical protein